MIVQVHRLIVYSTTYQGDELDQRHLGRLPPRAQLDAVAQVEQLLLLVLALRQRQAARARRVARVAGEVAEHGMDIAL